MKTTMSDNNDMFILPEKTGKIKLYEKPILQCIKEHSSLYKRPDCMNSQFLVYSEYPFKIVHYPLPQ